MKFLTLSFSVIYQGKIAMSLYFFNVSDLHDIWPFALLLEKMVLNIKCSSTRVKTKETHFKWLEIALFLPSEKDE